jgi:hypothetical protein
MLQFIRAALWSSNKTVAIDTIQNGYLHLATLQTLGPNVIKLFTAVSYNFL